jgi:hypothetical protein
MRNIFKKGILLLAGTLVAAGVEAGNPDRAGQAGATQLLINPWARSSGWGGVHTAGVRGIESMNFNPAGLTGNRQKTEIGFAHTVWLSGMGIGINAFGLNQKLGEYNAIGLAITSFDFGDIKVTREDQPEESGATYNITMLNVGLSYAHKFSDNISTGITVRTVAEGVPDASAQGVSLDAGIQYTAGDNERTKFGVALRNVGPPMRFSGNGLSSRGTLEGYEGSMTLQRRSDEFELPSVLTIGISYDLFSDTSNANMFTVAGNFTSNAFSKDQFGVGLQYSFKSYLSLRAGYVYEPGMLKKETQTSAYSGPSAGVSLDVPFGKDGIHRFAIDYSYRMSGSFKGTHTFGARIGI